MHELRGFAVAAGLLSLLVACSQPDPKTENKPVQAVENKPVTQPPLSVTTFDQLKAAKGQVVRVKGPVQHEKLGDTILVDGLDILCPDLRLPDGVTEAELQGRLELWEPPVAEISDRGEISQGVAEGTTRWVLRECTRV